VGGGHDGSGGGGLRPWLIEVDAPPAPACSCELERRAKGTLVAGTLRLLDPGISPSALVPCSHTAVLAVRADGEAATHSLRRLDMLK
jgi:hypothetical protein